MEVEASDAKKESFVTSSGSAVEAFAPKDIAAKTFSVEKNKDTE